MNNLPEIVYLTAARPGVELATSRVVSQLHQATRYYMRRIAMHIIYGGCVTGVDAYLSAVLTSVVAACQISVLSEIPENLSGLCHCCSAFAKRTVPFWRKNVNKTNILSV